MIRKKAEEALSSVDAERERKAVRIPSSPTEIIEKRGLVHCFTRTQTLEYAYRSHINFSVVVWHKNLWG